MTIINYGGSDGLKADVSGQDAEVELSIDVDEAVDTLMDKLGLPESAKDTIKDKLSDHAPAVQIKVDAVGSENDIENATFVLSKPLKTGLDEIDVGVTSISFFFEVLPELPKWDAECEPSTFWVQWDKWRQAVLRWQEEMQRWSESVKEGVVSPMPEFPVRPDGVPGNEPPRKGRKSCQKFLIKWFAKVRVTGVKYTIEFQSGYFIVCTRCW